MKADKKKKRNIWDIIAITILVLYFVAMFFVYYNKDIIYNISYKDYEKIVSEIDPDMPGYEIPIAKNVELAEHKVTDIRAYKKYYYMPDEYKKEMEEVAKDKEKVENYKFGYYDTFDYIKKACGRGYKLGYEILRADEVELEKEDIDNGVTNMYEVKFKISIYNKNGEKLRSVDYRREIAQVDGEWIFYDDYFSVPGRFLGYYEPVEMDVE